MVSMSKWNVHPNPPRQAGVGRREVEGRHKPNAGEVGGNGMHELISLMP